MSSTDYTQLADDKWFKCQTKKCNYGKCYYITFTANHEPTEADFQHLLNTLDGFYAQRNPFCLFVNTKNASPQISFKKLLSDWMKTNEHNAVAYLKKTAVVVHNTAVRMFLKLVFIIQPPKTDVQLFASLSEGATFLSIKRRRHHN